mmetsp:Transcript_49362/g.121161  ORF Transcript_49362/g.121161 Transcript_49362/m.121161 type:complete len:333 (-) Transcript_49362:928-1926(-)
MKRTHTPSAHSMLMAPNSSKFGSTRGVASGSQGSPSFGRQYDGRLVTSVALSRRGTAHCDRGSQLSELRKHSSSSGIGAQRASMHMPLAQSLGCVHLSPRGSRHSAFTQRPLRHWVFAWQGDASPHLPSLHETPTAQSSGSSHCSPNGASEQRPEPMHEPNEQGGLSPPRHGVLRSRQRLLRGLHTMSAKNLAVGSPQSPSVAHGSPSCAKLQVLFSDSQTKKSTQSAVLAHCSPMLPRHRCVPSSHEDDKQSELSSHGSPPSAGWHVMSLPHAPARHAEPVASCTALQGTPYAALSPLRSSRSLMTVGSARHCSAEPPSERSRISVTALTL